MGIPPTYMALTSSGQKFGRLVCVTPDPLAAQISSLVHLRQLVAVTSYTCTQAYMPRGLLPVSLVARLLPTEQDTCMTVSSPPPPHTTDLYQAKASYRVHPVTSALDQQLYRTPSFCLPLPQVTFPWLLSQPKFTNCEGLSQSKGIH